MHNFSQPQASPVSDDGLSIGSTAFQVQLDIQPFNKQEILVRLQPKAVEIVGIHTEKCDTAHKTQTLRKTYILPRPMNERALSANLSPSKILTLTAPWV